MQNCSSLINFLEDKYPLNTALDWDNSGLQIGGIERPVSNIAFSLNVTSAVLKKAISNNIDLLITHHPLFFKTIKNISLSSYIGEIIENSIKNDLNIYSLHTNFDVARQGVSDVLAKQYGFNVTKIMLPSSIELLKLVFYVPEQDFEKFRTEFLDLNLGIIGNYSHCSFSSNGEGTFKPLDLSNPFIGEKGLLSKVQEKKIETIIASKDLEYILKEILEIHPYEEPAYDILPMKNKIKSHGIGRYVVLENSQKVSDFASTLPCTIRGKNDPNRYIKKIAFCGGSASSLIQDAFNLGIELFIVGEINYHASLEAEELGISIIELGHEESEKPAMFYLSEIIKESFPDLNVKVF
jgi:dinuclear metal center YbgI/SA1388 family protein